MADEQGHKREEGHPEVPDIPDVPPPPYPGPPDGTTYPPQQAPPYQGTNYNAGYPPGVAYPPQGVTYLPAQGTEYPPKDGTQYPPPGYQQGQYPPTYGQAQYPAGAYPSGYQSTTHGGYPSQAYPGHGYAPAPNAMVITTQPVATCATREPREPKPETYLMLSVFTCLCCSPIFGLIAICFAVSADSAYAAGDVAGARRNGRTALFICVFGIILSFTVLALNLLLRTSMHH